MTEEPSVAAPPVNCGMETSFLNRFTRGLQRQMSARRFETYLDVLEACCACITVVALGILAVRAAVRLETRWDTFMYHIPVAALRGGLHIPYEINDGAQVKGFYDGFPPLPHLVQGILWRFTGSINATGVANYLAFTVFLVFCHVKLKARFWLVALIALTAPLVLIHTTVSYIDLFGNSFLALGVSAFVYMYLFDQHRDRSLLLSGLLGLTAAAWSKFQLVPLAGVFFVAFALLCLVRTRREGGKPGFGLALVAIAALLAAAPYIKNLAVYGNPFWPVRIPVVGELFPYAIDLRVAHRGERPPALAQLSQGALFVHSLFEINHPDSYPDRPRWIIDQGNSWLAFRMGGFWNISVVVYLVAAAGMALLLDRRKGVRLAAGALLLMALVAVLPQSHELRYYLFLPLCWAGIIGMLFAPLRRRYVRTAFCCLLVFAGLFLYMCGVNRFYYRIERIGYLEAASIWGASSWWEKLKPGVRYCVVDMVPIAILMTGPTMSELRIIDRSDERLCPEGSEIINKVVFKGVSGVVSEDALMQGGLEFLYAKHDPNAAADQFRKVLERNPNHYGATFQLARALDRAGKPAEARPIWEKMLKMAEASNDKDTLNTVLRRLEKKP